MQGREPRRDQYWQETQAGSAFSLAIDGTHLGWGNFKLPPPTRVSVIDSRSIASY